MLRINTMIPNTSKHNISTTMSPTSSNNEKTTMFYDGGCPLCSVEVAHYRRMDTGNNIHWLDINAQPESLNEHRISPIAAMKHLHVLNTNGDIVRGAYAFQTLWLELPRYRFLALLVSFPGFLWLMDKVYDQFAKRRFAKRMACTSDVNCSN